MEFDVIIRGGLVFDGRGTPPFPADVGIRGKRISSLSDLTAAVAETEIDASGLAIAPGFIDAHTHSDLAYVQGSTEVAAAPIRQGVTTEICGNCGFSAFPCTPERRVDLERHVGVLLGGPVGWADLAAWRTSVEEAGLYSNLAPLVGHGSLRAGVLGPEDRAPRDDELTTMVSLAEAALEQGAVGISSGLVYTPGVFAETAELVELCRVLARYGRPYATHVRGETHMVAESVGEAIEIGRCAGVPVHISHHKVAGKENWGRTSETLAIVHQARAAGVDVTLDAYPYTAASTLLYSILPPWVQEGGLPLMLERLADKRIRERARADFEQGLPGWENMQRAVGWNAIVVSSAPADPDLEGCSLAVLADTAGQDPVDFMADLLIQQRGDVIAILHAMSEPDVRNILAFEATMIGSDGIPLPGRPHPRLAGTFSRVLGRYCRQEGLLELAQALRKMTSQPAERFGIVDRGCLKEGAFADVVVFAPTVVEDRATFDDPLLPPEGVLHVVVNGQQAVRDGALVGVKAGRVL